MDIVGQWIDERCILDPTAAVQTSALHADYESYAREEFGFAMTAVRFGRDLSDRGAPGGDAGNADLNY
jgi:hypothetical protein